MGALVTAALNFVAGLLGLGNKQADANAAAALRQGGVDAQRSADLSAEVKILQAENKAILNVTSNEASMIDAMERRTF